MGFYFVTMRDESNSSHPTSCPASKRHWLCVVISFNTSAYDAKFDPVDSILSLAERLAK